MTAASNGGESTVRVPGSKSLTLRHLILAALARGSSTLVDALDCDDSRVLAGSLEKLGAVIRWDVHQVTVTGTGGGIAPGPLTLDAGESGAALRFLAALTARGHGDYHIVRRGRLASRPVGELLAALDAPALSRADGTLVVSGSGATGGRNLRFELVRSSQTLSALLLASPLEGGRLNIEVPETIPSAAYVDLTLQAMACHQVTAEHTGHLFRVEPRAVCHPADVTIEGDWSSAAMLMVAAALTGSPLRLAGLAADSRQGDRYALGLLQAMAVPASFMGGELRISGRATIGIDADFDQTPDLAPPFAVLAATIPATSCLRGLQRLVDKESDRFSALASALEAVGATISVRPGQLIIRGGVIHPAELDGAGDHRLVMALSLLRLLNPEIRVSGHSCVGKSYPGFFADLAQLNQSP